MKYTSSIFFNVYCRQFLAGTPRCGRWYDISRTDVGRLLNFFHSAENLNSILL